MAKVFLDIRVPYCANPTDNFGKDIFMNEETKLKIKVLKYLKSIPNSFTMKLSDSFCAGYPDILFILQGRAYFYELKSAKGVKAPLQIWTIEQLKSAGAQAHFVTSLEEVKKVLDR